MRTWETASGDKLIQLLSGRSNAFLLISGGKKIAIDTGPGRKWSKLEKNLKKLAISQLDYLVLTHAHFDHAANATKLKQRYGAIVIIHQAEALHLKQGTNPETKGTICLYKLFLNIFGKSLMSKLRYEPCQPDLTLEETFDLRPFGINAYLMHTPGHTPGSISLIAGNELALAGDCLFGIFPTSVYPPVALDTKELVNSWGKLLETSCRLFFPSHGKEKSRAQLLEGYEKMSRS